MKQIELHLHVGFLLTLYCCCLYEGSSAAEKTYKLKTKGPWKGGGCCCWFLGRSPYFFTAWPTFAFLVPRTFFIRFLRSLRCLRVIFFFSYSPWRPRRCFGSNFLA
uniref:Putative secreted protein n=1 Tax=Anopheles marajoara TaxID=58244 RepID=A0A2M4C8F9_9DIPT